MLHKLDDALAPRPTRRSYARSLYDALASLSGPSRLDQIIEMIPATDDADKWSAATPERVQELLRSAEIHGYVSYQTATARWTIANRKWFENCQKRIREAALERADRPPRQFQKSASEAASEEVPHTITLKVAAAIVIAGFICGAITTMAVIALAMTV